MAKKQLGEGKRVRAKDLFTLFTGLWGHEEFEAYGHRLVKIKLGSIIADYEEGEPDRKPLKANKYGLAHDGEMKTRHMHVDNLTTSVLEFDPEARPHLRILYRDMLRQVKNSGRKRLVNGQISWNILSFVTLGPNGHKCYWLRTNIGTKKDTVYIPLLVRVNSTLTLNMSIEEQCDAVGDDFFAGECDLAMKRIPSLTCAGI